MYIQYNTILYNPTIYIHRYVCIVLPVIESVYGGIYNDNYPYILVQLQPVSFHQCHYFKLHKLGSPLIRNPPHPPDCDVAQTTLHT